MSLETLSPSASNLLQKLVSGGSPDIPVAGAPEATGELVAEGLLKKVADRYEVSAKAWVALRELETEKAEAVPEPKVRVKGLTPGQVRWCDISLHEVGWNTEHDPSETIAWGQTWIEGTAEDLGQVVLCLEQMAWLIETDETCDYTHDPTDVPEAIRERVRDQAKKCCETAAEKVQRALSAA